MNWQELFDYVGFPAFLKPYSGGGWKHVYHVHSPEEFFQHYNQTGDLCMTLQHGVVFEEYYRCYVVGQEKVHIMKYDPRAPHHERYVKGNPPPSSEALRARIEKDALTLCRVLGYDLNTVEFAVEGGVPYAIDFLNPAPDAEITSVGQENFDWIVNAVAEMAVKMALSGENPARELRWAGFLKGIAGEEDSRRQSRGGWRSGSGARRRSSWLNGSRALLGGQPRAALPHESQYEEKEFQTGRFCDEGQSCGEERGRISRGRPRTSAQHFETDPGSDSVGGAGGDNRGNQLRDSDFQVQARAGRVCCVYQSLQFLPAGFVGARFV